LGRELGLLLAEPCRGLARLRGRLGMLLEGLGVLLRRLAELLEGLRLLLRGLLAARLLLAHLAHGLAQLREPLLGLRQRLVKATGVNTEFRYYISYDYFCQD